MTSKAPATVLALALLLGVLAPTASVRAEQHADPLEKINRPVFRFNDALDRWFLEPIATGYDFVMPNIAQTGINNFFTNLRFPIVLANCLLQGKIDEGATSVGRFVINTTIGVAGFGDPASHLKVPAPDEDFGQTLGRWGLNPGAYLVLPLLGPSDLRDTVGLGVDSVSTVWPFFVNTWVSLGTTGARVVNTRSLYLEEVRDARSQSLDYYSFVRDAYLQRRQSLVSDQVGGSSDKTPASSDDGLYFPDADKE